MTGVSRTWVARTMLDLADLEVRQFEAQIATLAGRIYLRLSPLRQEAVRLVAQLDGVTVEQVIERRIRWIEQRVVRAARGVRS